MLLIHVVYCGTVEVASSREGLASRLSERRQALTGVTHAASLVQGQSAGPAASIPSNDVGPSTRAASMDTSTGAAAGSDGAGYHPLTATGMASGDLPADARSPVGAGVKVDMDAHAQEMLALPVDVPESESSTLPGWAPSPVRPRSRTHALRHVLRHRVHVLSVLWRRLQEFRQALVQLRAEAAITPPPDEPSPGQASKKKMPANLAAKLELLTRPFYINAEEAANTNRAKKMLWGTMLPVLTTWSAEATIKTKMQKINSQIIGQYQLEKERFENIAVWHGAAPSSSAHLVFASPLSVPPAVAHARTLPWLPFRPVLLSHTRGCVCLHHSLLPHRWPRNATPDRCWPPSQQPAQLRVHGLCVCERDSAACVASSAGAARNGACGSASRV